ncbi:hypothetical protein JCM3770_004780 [Rhodotorula araucariae]
MGDSPEASVSSLQAPVMDDTKPRIESNTLTNGFPAPAASANTPGDEVVQHYTDLFATLLRSLSTLVPPGTSADAPASPVLRDATSWGELRIALRNSFGSPGAAFATPGALARDRAVQIVQAVGRIGARRLARDVAAVEKHAVLAVDEQGARSVWYGTVEAFTWLRAVRSALLWAESTASPAPPVDSASPASAGPSLAFGFAPPPAPGALAKKLEAKKKARLSSASASPAVTPAAVQVAPRATSLANASSPVPATVPPVSTPGSSALDAATSITTPSGAPTGPPASPPTPNPSAPVMEAAAFSTRTSGTDSAQPVASTSASPLDPSSVPAVPPTTLATPVASAPLPTGPPSAGFAPPPAPGTAFEKPVKSRKPRASSSKPGAAPRHTSDGTGKGKSVGEVNVPPVRGEGIAERPARKRKVPLKLTFEQDSDLGDAWDEEDGEDGTPAAAAGGPKGRRSKRRSSLPASGDGARGKRGRFSGFDDDAEDSFEGGEEDDEVDELASDYEEQMEKKAKAARERQLTRERSEELNKNRFAIGSCVMVKFPNYSWFPAIVLDPKTAPVETQGKRVKGAYLVKSIPSGADHRWVAPEDGSILAIQPTQLDDILLGRYKSAPPQSWVKWRSELVEAVMLIKSPERLADWLSRPTDLELAEAAKAEKKRAARAASASYW